MSKALAGLPTYRDDRARILVMCVHMQKADSGVILTFWHALKKTGLDYENKESADVPVPVCLRPADSGSLLSIRARSATDDILLCFVVRSQVSGILLSWSLSHGWHH